MRNESLINELSSLLRQIEDYEDAIHRQREIKSEIEVLNNSKNLPLERFDSEYLPKFIRNKIGDAPKNFAKLNPVKLIKPVADRKSKVLKQYADNKKRVTAQYYEEFSEQRDNIQQKSEAEFKQNLSLIKTETAELSEKIDDLRNKIQSTDLLPRKFLKSKNIKKMIKYLEEWRVNNITEAIATLCLEENIEQNFQKLSQRLSTFEDSIQSLNNLIRDEIKIELENINRSIDL